MADKRKPQTPLLEWITAAVGLIVALVLLGILVREAVSGGQDPLPELVVEAAGLEAGHGGYALQFEVRNLSGRTAAAVRVQGVLRSGGQDVETSTATIDYVPGHSSARGGLQFTRDPRAHALDLRATGYQLP